MHSLVNMLTLCGVGVSAHMVTMPPGRTASDSSGASSSGSSRKSKRSKKDKTGSGEEDGKEKILIVLLDEKDKDKGEKKVMVDDGATWHGWVFLFVHAADT